MRRFTISSITTNRLPRFVASIAASLTLLCAPASALRSSATSVAQQGAAVTTHRIVVVGDIHGDLGALVRVLRSAGVMNAQMKWSGAETTLVQTGDMIDRGPQSRAVMDLLMSLQQDAPRQGGRVLVLLGNHEAMNMAGDWRYVTADDYAAFADGESEHRQQKAQTDAQRLKRAGASDASWRTAHPLGMIERALAFSADGKYGRWLRTLPAVLKVNDTLFAHGGISAEMAAWPLARINQTVSDELKAYDGARRYLVARGTALPFDSLQELAHAASAPDAANSRDVLRFRDYDNWLSVRDDGPLWCRDYARWTDAEGAPIVSRILSTFGVSRLVGGHTVQPGHIASRFDSRVFVIDTGMFAGYFPNGRASALVIDDGVVTTIYAGAADER